jgi:hypothetical protein
VRARLDGHCERRGSGRFYATAAAALADLPVQAIFAAPPELVPEVPSNVIMQRRVPQLALLPHVDAVVCHGGHNTVCEALAHGLPLVIAPIKDDQPIVADQVVAAGAGLRVKFGRVQAPELRAAVRRILDEPSFRDAASACALLLPVAPTPGHRARGARMMVSRLGPLPARIARMRGRLARPVCPTRLARSRIMPRLASPRGRDARAASVGAARSSMSSISCRAICRASAR